MVVVGVECSSGVRVAPLLLAPGSLGGRNTAAHREELISNRIANDVELEVCDGRDLFSCVMPDQPVACMFLIFGKIDVCFYEVEGSLEDSDAFWVVGFELIDSPIVVDVY